MTPILGNAIQIKLCLLIPSPLWEWVLFVFICVEVSWYWIYGFIVILSTNGQVAAAPNFEWLHHPESWFDGFVLSLALLWTIHFPSILITYGSSGYPSKGSRSSSHQQQGKQRNKTNKRRKQRLQQGTQRNRQTRRESKNHTQMTMSWCINFS